ncbi:protein of unknown function (S-adenosyl-L-methionine-dependent methyltransferases 128-284) [Magnetospirillum sp. XM-1]|uniref:class I SAM-dependent methyltransferase n=1 Tax=Magnetospirillum sp. XM-1 TaxID=1663591 RepID=UPI00073DDB0D|nr:class I SAM-dependent methyltransferase [Magnetospirillum sp. XM-1]CUW38063.1 protein of unknown function (S-adenosyl-L-methionine-dependent methyltransferases 128-284) [Magnetospirillum sp. XM-1]
MPPLTRHPIFYSPTHPGSEELDANQQALVDDINRRLASGALTMERVPCLCGSDEFDMVASLDRYRIVQDTVLCRKCGLMQSQPRMTEESLIWFYGSDAYRELYGGARQLPHTPDKFERQARSCASRGEAIAAHLDLSSINAVAEVGCGAGWNLWSFHQAGKRVIGCDYSPALTEAGRAAGMDIRQGVAERALAGETADLLLLSHVVEHFRDPIGEVRQLLSLLSPRYVYIEVPDVDSFCLGTLQSAHNYTFSKATLVTAMAKAGLAVMAEIPRGIHFAILFRVEAPSAPLPDLGGEYARVAAVIRRYERRERIKGWLEGLGLLSAARRIASLLRR